MPENATTKSSKAWAYILISLVVLTVTLVIFYALGQIRGVEFSPDDFSRREFSYNQTPYFNWVIRKKTFTKRTTSLEEHLTTDGFIPIVVNRTKTWHLIRDSGSNSAYASDQCDARFLTSYLDLSNEVGDDYWTVWTADFPKCAKLFWPHVAELARDEMYLKVPDVMQFAMELTKDNPKRFDDSLKKLLGEVYLELGEIDLELDRLERAKARLQKSSELGDKKTASRAEDLLARCESEQSRQPVTTKSDDQADKNDTSDNLEKSDE